MAGAASANTISLAPAGEFTMVSEGKITFSEEVEEARIACNLTMTGTFARGPIAVEETGPSGSITGFRWSECTGGELDAALSLGWSTHWNILGSWPFLRGVLLALTGYILIHIFLGSCLYSGETGLLISLFGENPYTTESIATWLGLTIRKISGGILCPRSIRIGGVMVMRPTQRVTAA
jgi:hypothetical protein